MDCFAAKSARLRQAKEEADKEAALYRAQREEEYQAKKRGVSFLKFLHLVWRLPPSRSC